jgi:ABC-type branched-subunit amino acid transport system substrate-binding protein/TolA-binding protein
MMKLRRGMVRITGLLLTLAFLVGCGLAPPKRKVGMEVESRPLEERPLQLLAKAEGAYQRGDLEKASQGYRQLVMAYPRSPQAAKAMLRQGEIEFRLERYPEAASWFQQVVNQFPVGPEGDSARLGLLRCYLKMERFNDTIETGRTLMTYLPQRNQRSEAAEVVGDAKSEQTEYTEAIRWYAKADELLAGENRVELAKKVETAASHLDENRLSALLTEYPESFPHLQLQSRMAEIEMQTGKLPRAQSRLQALLIHKPDHPAAVNWQAMLQQIEEWLRVDMSTVGCLLPLSGRYKAYGDRVLRGLVMAAQDLNERYGTDQDIRLIIRDSGGDAESTAAAVRDLVFNQRVAALIGPLSRRAAETAAKVADELGVPIITLTQKEGISETGDYVFRDFLSNEQQTRALVTYSVLGLGYKRFAILYPNDSYGTRLMNLFWNELDRLDAEVRGIEVYDVSQTDFADQIKKLVGLYYPRPEDEQVEETEQVAENDASIPEEGTEPEESVEEEPLPIVDFDAVFIPDTYEKVGLIAPQLAYYDVTGARLLGTNLWHSPKLLEMAASYLQNAIFADGFFAGGNQALTQGFVRKFQENFGETPDYPEAQAYDTLHLLAQALHQPEVRSRLSLRLALLAVKELPGVTGKATVTAEGEVVRQPFLIAIKRRRLVEVQVDFDLLQQRQASWEYFLGLQGDRTPDDSSQ